MLDDGTRSIDEYTYNLNDLLGKGTYASVYLGRLSSSDLPVAVKVIPVQTLNQEAMANLEREVAILKGLPRHDNIVKVYGIYQTGSTVYVVTEYCEGKLESGLGRKQVALGTQYGFRMGLLRSCQQSSI